MYARTLASYEKFFGATPPVDIWPSAENQPAARLISQRWVDLSAYWVFPKKLAGLAAAFAVLGAGALGLAGCQPGQVNIFELTGTGFLHLYLWMLVGGLVGSVTLRYYLCGPHGDADNTDLQDIYEIAYLAGGGPRVIHTALVMLYDKNAVVLNARDSLQIKRSPTPPPPSSHDVELLVWDSVPENDGYASFDSVRETMQPVFERIATRLLEKGLFSPDTDFANKVAIAILGLVSVVGSIKVAVGIVRDRPVALLVILTVIAWIVTTLLFLSWKNSRRSGRGGATLRALRKNFAARRPDSRQRTGAPLPLGSAISLYGLSILPLYQLGHLQTYLGPTASAATFGVESSCGSSCGGGGCGSGCGGCGGD